MNNGSRDTSHNDIQKLQQQLQDIKEQVKLLQMTHDGRSLIYTHASVLLIGLCSVSALLSSDIGITEITANVARLINMEIN